MQRRLHSPCISIDLSVQDCIYCKQNWQTLQKHIFFTLTQYHCQESAATSHSPGIGQHLRYKRKQKQPTTRRTNKHEHKHTQSLNQFTTDAQPIQTLQSFQTSQSIQTLQSLQTLQSFQTLQSLQNFVFCNNV